MTLIPVIVCKILAVKVIVLIQIFTPEAAPRKYYFLDSFKKFCKIPKKTFRTRSMFVTASYFCFKTLLKMNSTIDAFTPIFTNLARAVISHNTLERLLLCYEFQARDQEFFRAGEFSRNQGTWINISSTTHERKAPQGKNIGFFLLETLKITFKMRNLTQDGHNQSIFFQN